MRGSVAVALALVWGACRLLGLGTPVALGQVSDSVLSKAASDLEAAGYLGIRKGAAGRRFRTWLYLTDAGRDAPARHLEALQDLASAARSAGAARAGGDSSRPGARPNT
ncbi:transcriptional regulator [Streptomyces sp. NPDC055808]